jgi:FlaA1/EpsC-like NDP-sugar epimerase
MLLERLKSRKFLLGDLSIAFVTVWISFAIRFGIGTDLSSYLILVLLMAILAAMMKPLILWLLGIYSIYWKYIGMREIRRLVLGMAIGSGTLVIALLILNNEGLVPMAPRSVIAIDFVLSLALVALLRKIAYSDSFRHAGNGAG